jgi:glucokinase
MAQDVIIGVDLGGTRLRAARMDDNLNILAREEMMTMAHEGFAPTFDRIKSAIRSVLPTDGSHISGIGICIPGPTNPYTGIIELGTNLSGWHNIPLTRLLTDEFGVPVYLGNDANMSVLAETVIGAAVGYRHVIFFTVSTGIGGGVINDGRLLLGNEGLGAELGHLVMVMDGGRITTMEKEVAGPALARTTRARIEAGERSIISELVTGDLNHITGKTVGIAAQQGDALAISVLQRAGTILGCGVASLLHVFNPEILVFGGSVSNVGDLLFEPMRAAIQQYCIDTAYWRSLKIEMAQLGENVSLIGSGALVLTRGGFEDVTQLQRTLKS